MNSYVLHSPFMKQSGDKLGDRDHLAIGGPDIEACSIEYVWEPRLERADGVWELYTHVKYFRVSALLREACTEYCRKVW